MGYEGHLMREPGDTKADLVERSMGLLLTAPRRRSAATSCRGAARARGNTNTWITELQAGSYCLMDTEYVPHAPEFESALFVNATVISLTPGRWGVLDAGLKALGMDHGDPKVLDVGDCWFVSDEHITFGLTEGSTVAVGDRVRVVPSHVDPTFSQHERLHLVDDDEVLEVWDVDLRGW